MLVVGDGLVLGLQVVMPERVARRGGAGGAQHYGMDRVLVGFARHENMGWDRLHAVTARCARSCRPMCSV